MSSLKDYIDALLENENLSPLDADYLDYIQPIIATLELPEDIAVGNPYDIKVNLRNKLLQLLDQVLATNPQAATNIDADGISPLELLDWRTDARYISIIIACKLLIAIEDEYLVTKNARQLAKDLVSTLMQSDQQHSNDCFIQANRVIRLFALTILDIAPKPFQNGALYLNQFVIRMQQSYVPCNIIRLILASNDHSWIRYLDPYPDRADLHTIMLQIATKQFADTTAVSELSLLDERFQVKRPEDDEDAAQLAHALLTDGASLKLFMYFEVALLRKLWDDNIPADSTVFNLFNVRMLNAGCTPEDLGIECDADDPQLLDIAGQRNLEALTAMHILVNTYGFELPYNIAELYKQHVFMLATNPNLPSSALFALGLIHQEGDIGIGIIPDFLASAGFYAAAIDKYQHTRSMVNLGYMIESGLIDANNGIPDYVKARGLYFTATRLNDPLAVRKYKELNRKLIALAQPPVEDEKLRSTDKMLTF